MINNHNPLNELHTRKLSDLLSILEEFEVGNTSHSLNVGVVIDLINVDMDEDSIILVAEVVEFGCNGLARTAPLS